MIFSEQEDKELDRKLKSITTLEIQGFVSQFHNSLPSNNTFTFIQQNFIKKYRFKNSLNQNNTNPHSSVTQFINAFKETIKYYEAYHEHLQATLDKFTFTKDLKRFVSQLYKSETRAINFFMTQIQLHRVFVEQNETKYHKKVESLNQICSICKENMVRKSFQNVKQEVGYDFKDPFKLYEKGKFTRGNQFSLFQSRLDSLHALQRIQELELADMKMKQLIKQSKKINFSQLDEINDHFDKKFEFEMSEVNKIKVKEMFYDLQIQLDNQSSQLEQYVDQLLGFNDRLSNYNASAGVNSLEQQQKQQFEPREIQRQLKYNFGKIVRKIYSKILELIQKKKNEAISVETQVNFTQQSALKQMDKQNKKLGLQLRQSQQQKKFLISALKSQNDTLKKQIQRISEENNKIDIGRQEALLQKNASFRKQQKLIKFINQLKKQIERLNGIVERKEVLMSKKQLLMSSASKLKSKVTLQGEEQVTKEEQKQKHNNTEGKRISKRHLVGVANIERHQQQQTLPATSDNKEPSKSSQLQLLQELQRHQIQLLNSLAKKKMKNHKKKFAQPRRSKLTETLNVQESDLKKSMNRLSQAKLLEEQEIYQLSLAEKQKQIWENNPYQNDQQDEDQIQDSQSQQERVIKELTIQEVIQQNQQSEDQYDQQNQKHLKNHKSKTFNKIQQIDQSQPSQHGRSQRQVQESEEQIKKKLEDLRKLQKLKQIQIKVSQLAQKDPHPLYKKCNSLQRLNHNFNIQKQVQQCIMSPKINKSVDKRKSLDKKLIPNRGANHPSLYKEDLLKRFGRNSQNLQSSPIQSRPSISHLQPPKVQNKKLQSQKQLNSCSVIQSKNFISYCQQVSKQPLDGKNHIGTQTQWSRDNILKMIYETQLQVRGWNDIMVTFDSFKFGYEEFLNQLGQLIAKQQRNPIRKLNGYKGSSDVLKKAHNYRFTKQNLFYNQYYGEDESMLNNNDQDRNMKKSNLKNGQQKNYFIPRFSTGSKKINMDEMTKMNHTTIEGFYKPSKDRDQQNQEEQTSDKKLTSSISLEYLKNTHKNWKLLDPISSVSITDVIYGNFKKKGPYTQHQLKTDGNYRISIIDPSPDNSKNKLPTINQSSQIIKLPVFQKQDAQNLFFTIESAKMIEDNIKNKSSVISFTFVTLQQHEIRFTTQILATLAHIHLVEPKSYEQIKNVLLYPAKLLTNKKLQIQPGSSFDFLKNSDENETQSSLKKGLGHVMQLHRKCIQIESKRKQRSKTKDNGNKIENTTKLRTKNICDHLLAFRRKIGDVIRIHEALKNKSLLSHLA